MRVLLVAAVLALSVSAQPAIGAPEDWLACSDAAPDMRSLRQCGTVKEDSAACQMQRAGGGVLGPSACLDQVVRRWTTVVRVEEDRVPPEARNGRPPFVEWRAERDRLCRDDEQIRLSTERYGEGHALFEAAECELRLTIRRAVESAAIRRGFR